MPRKQGEGERGTVQCRRDYWASTGLCAPAAALHNMLSGRGPERCHTKVVADPSRALGALLHVRREGIARMDRIWRTIAHWKGKQPLPEAVCDELLLLCLLPLFRAAVA